MPSLAERQQQFAQALLSAEPMLPPGLTGPRGAVGAERFAVYRNNVAVSLIEALRSAYPVVNRLVGNEFFGAMARAHSRRHPPSSPVLLAYGGGFPDFVAAFEPAEALLYLADMARLEWLCLESYHAAEAEPLAIAPLHALPATILPELCLTLHPSARFVRLAHPALAIWHAHQGPDEPEDIELAEGPEHLLIVRPRAEVKVIALSSGTLAFLEAIRARATITQGVETALAIEPALPIGDLFTSLFGAGAFSGFTGAHASVNSHAEEPA